MTEISPGRIHTPLLPAILPAIKLLPAIYLAPACHRAPAIQLLSTIQRQRPLSISCRPSLHLGFSFSSRLIVLVEVARVEEECVEEWCVEEECVEEECV